MTKFLIPQDLTPSSPLVVKSSHWHKFIGFHLIDHVKTGFTITSGGGLTAVVAVGNGFIQGCYFETNATINQSLVNSAVNHVYVQLTRNGALEPVDWNIVSNTTGTPPTDSMKIAEVTTSGGVITLITDRRTVKSDNQTIISRFKRWLSNNLINYVEFKAPDGLTSNKTYILPSIDGANKDVLATSGAGVLSFIKSGGTFLFVSNGGSVVTTGALADMSNSSYSLPANDYAQILVLVYGTHTDLNDASETYNTKSTAINVAGVDVKSKSSTMLQATSSQISDNSGDMNYMFFWVGVQTGATTIKLRGDHDGTTSETIAYEGMLVIGLR